MKSSRIESFEDARKELKKLFEECWNWDLYILQQCLICSFVEIWFYINKDISIMQISFFGKIVLFLTIYCISDMSIKNNILRKLVKRANRAKKV